MEHRHTTPHAQHVAHITHRKQDRINYFSALPHVEQAVVFSELSPTIQQDLLERLSVRALVPLLDHFDLENAEHYLRRITNTNKRSALSERLKRELKEKAEYFTRFHPKAAFDMVHFNYILLPYTHTIGAVADAVDMHFEETGNLPEVLVQKDGIFIGEITPGTLIREDNDKIIGQFVKKIPTLLYNTPAPQIAQSFIQSSVHKIVVLDNDDSIVGIVYAKEVLNLFGEKPTESLYSFAGITENERPFDSVPKKFTARYQWLIINLMTAFLAASVVGYFEATLQEITILAMYLPIIAGMGGNAGTQSLAIFMRGITLGEITLENALPAILREVYAGMLQGAFHGIITGGIAVLLGQGPLLGIVVALAIFFNLIIAALSGALIPLVMKHLGKDPAISSGIILTTFTDTLGFMAVFILANIFLR